MGPVYLGARLAALAVACSGLFAAGPLTHAPAFRQAFGQAALSDPRGVAIDPSRDIWVADTGHSRVVEFTPAGRRVAAFGGGLDAPEGIAVDAAGHVWVADTGHDRVVEFSPGGRQLAVFGEPGRGHGELRGPAALAVTPIGDVWVADQGNSRVEEFSAAGRYRLAFGVPNAAGVALSSRGDVWVSSPSYAGGNTVAEFSPAGHRLLSFGTTQAGYGDLSNPGGIAVGPNGRVYVTQPDFGLVSVFTPAGRFYTEFGLTAPPSRAGQDLQFPQGLAVT
ncbi:MAG: NHL repeat-containing protein [Streptosporangiaceae bacterium]